MPEPQTIDSVIHDVMIRLEKLENRDTVQIAGAGGGGVQLLPDSFYEGFWNFEAFKALVSDAIEWAWDEILHTAADIWNVLKNLTGTWVTIFTEWGSIAWNYINKTAANIWDVLKNLSGSWYTMVLEWGDIAWGYISSTWQNIMDVLGLFVQNTSKLVLHMPMNSVSGNITRDYSGEGNDGDCYNMFVNAGGKFGYCAQFNGSTAYIEVPYDGTLNFIQFLTIFVWVKPHNSISANGYIIAKNSSGANHQYALLYNYTNQNVVLYLNGNPYGSSSVDSVPKNQWTCVAVTWQASTSQIKYYINGAYDVGSSYGTNLSGTTYDLQIGRRVGGIYFYGFLDELRLFYRNLPAEEIRSMYIMGAHISLPQYFLYNIIQGTWDMFVGTFLDTIGWSNLVSWATITFSDLLGTIGKHIDLATHLINKTWSDIVSWASITYGNILSTIGKHIDLATHLIDKTWSDIVTWASITYSNLLGTIGKHIDLATHLITKTWSDIVSWASITYSNLLGTIGKHIDLATHLINKTWTDLVSWASITYGNILATIGQHIDLATHLINKSWTNLYDWLSTKPGALTQAGDIATGAIDTLAMIADSLFSGSGGLLKFATNVLINPTAITQDNMVVNGSFEAMRTGSIPDNWADNSSGTGSPYVIRTSSYYKEGGYSLREYCTYSGGNSVAEGLSDYIPVTQGTTYLIRGMYRLASGSITRVTIGLHYYNESKVYEGQGAVFEHTDQSSTWKEASHTHTVPSGQYYARVYITARAESSGKSGSACWDGVWMFKQIAWVEELIDGIFDTLDKFCSWFPWLNWERPRKMSWSGEYAGTGSDSGFLLLNAGFVTIGKNEFWLRLTGAVQDQICGIKDGNASYTFGDKLWFKCSLTETNFTSTSNTAFVGMADDFYYSCTDRMGFFITYNAVNQVKIKGELGNSAGYERTSQVNKSFGWVELAIRHFGTYVEFYVDGSKIGTLSTRLPSGSDARAVGEVDEGATTAATKIYIRNLEVAGSGA